MPGHRKGALTRILLGFILAWAVLPARAEQGVPMAHDLSSDARAALDKGGVVLVAFVGSDCGYCETVLNEFLIPMTLNPDYQGKLVMRRVVARAPDELKDFNGKASSHGQFAGRNGVRLVPTVMLFDDKGRLLAKPLVGLSTVDYYGYYLDQAIDTAIGKVRKLLPSGLGS